MKYGFGIDLGGTTVKLAFFNQQGDLLDKWEIPTVTDEKGKHILPHICASVADYLEKSPYSREDILGIGIGVPGPVSPDGTVNGCVNLGWGTFQLQNTLEELTGFPVQAGNDATVAALGESWKGGGQGCHSMVMATLGTGVGGGIVVNGNVIHGSHGAAGEIGHIPLNPQETDTCSCGKKGCVEQYCSATGIVRLAKKYLAAHATPSSLHTIDPLTCKDIFDAAKEKDAAALEILDQVYDYMGRFLATVCCVIDPEQLVLGGGVSKAGQPLLDGVVKAYQKYAFPSCRNVHVSLATLGNDAGAYGAWKLILNRFGL